MGEMGQDDIDKLLADALGGDASSFSFDDSDGGAQNQDEIDALIAAAADSSSFTPGAKKAAPAPADDGGAQSQNDIDALIAAATGGAAEPSGGGSKQDDIDALLAESSALEENSGAQSQDDIDALLAGAAQADSPSGQSNQDDIDALLADSTIAGALPGDGGKASQDDIDALLGGAGADDDDAGGTASQDDIDALFASTAGGAAEESLPDAEEDASSDEADLDSLLGGNAGGVEGAPDDQDDIDALINGVGDLNSDDVTEEEPTNGLDHAGIDQLLSEQDAQEEEPEPAGTMGHSEELPEDDLDDMVAGAQALQKTIVSPERASRAAVPGRAAAPAAMPAYKTPEVPPLSQAQLANIQESLSLSGTAGEVENLAGQMSGLLGQLSERARRFQAAWLNTDQENRELHHRLMLAEQKGHALAGEKDSLLNEISSLRKQCSRVEGEKLAAVESNRTEIASLELKLREQESRNNMYECEVRSLKEELERARNESTGSDLESRRARFELERLSAELAAERQERSRLQRALDNREKELQAMQAQSAGHASTLFLDELHRLVRRLESELDIRTSAAHEALSVVDRLRFTPEQQMYAATLRAAISTACGLTPDECDALKAMDKQSATGQASLEPQPAPGIDSFRSALDRYDFARASAIASAQMRSGEKTPWDFMRELHEVEGLRRPDIAEHLDDLAAILRGIKSIQEASDRARGRENEQSEKLYVLIFDLLHTLVRLKLVSRATPAIWDLFLELRGRFSFLTSDRQWRDYRDRVLGGVSSLAV